MIRKRFGSLNVSLRFANDIKTHFNADLRIPDDYNQSVTRASASERRIITCMKTAPLTIWLFTSVAKT